MKIPVLLFALASLGAVTGFAEKIDLGAGKSVHTVIPESWTRADPADLPAMGKSARYVTKNGSNDAVLITILAVPDDRFSAPENLKALAEEAAEQFVAGSVEGKANLKELKVGASSGFFATFTDANLVGKPTVKDDYKTVTSCFVYLGDHVLVTATVFSDDLAGKAYTEGMRIVKSLSLDRPRDSL